MSLTAGTRLGPYEVLSHTAYVVTEPLEGQTLRERLTALRPAGAQGD